MASGEVVGWSQRARRRLLSGYGVGALPGYFVASGCCGCRSRMMLRRRCTWISFRAGTVLWDGCFKLSGAVAAAKPHAVVGTKWRSRTGAPVTYLCGWVCGGVWALNTRPEPGNSAVEKSTVL